MRTLLREKKGESHEAMSCLNMNECCVNASAVIFRQEAIPLCSRCVCSSSSRERCCCSAIFAGWKFSKMLMSKARSMGILQKRLYIHLQHFILINGKDFIPSNMPGESRRLTLLRDTLKEAQKKKKNEGSANFSFLAIKGSAWFPGQSWVHIPSVGGNVPQKYHVNSNLLLR